MKSSFHVWLAIKITSHKIANKNSNSTTDKEGSCCGPKDNIDIWIVLGSKIPGFSRVP